MRLELDGTGSLIRGNGSRTLARAAFSAAIEAMPGVNAMVGASLESGRERSRTAVAGLKLNW